ncbi:hypothetical protein [Thalassospira sp. A3_1]|uniref:hypothetical protein n=1 Tax=Thalassospira sp. A3_1 TaxID=2821088 RepID=UPI001ADD544D|nr:hypothetical protein [Thalassospira sp. A3_1]MBO9507485.1 hypothetical protein [Thalassospira sp. A3_1]
MADTNPAIDNPRFGISERTIGPLTKHFQQDRHSREGGNPVSFNRARIPGLRSASPGMTILINHQTNPATPQPPASPNATNRVGQTKADRTRRE